MGFRGHSIEVFGTGTRLAGLNAEYVYKQLQAFRTPLRPHGVLMKNETRSLGEAQMRAVSAYVQSL